MAFTKYKKWEHEAEYRYVMIFDNPEDEIPDYLNYEVPIYNVYEGCESNWSSLHNSNGAIVKTHKLKKDSNDYRLII